MPLFLAACQNLWVGKPSEAHVQQGDRWQVIIQPDPKGLFTLTNCQNTLQKQLVKSTPELERRLQDFAEETRNRPFFADVQIIKTPDTAQPLTLLQIHRLTPLNPQSCSNALEAIQPSVVAQSSQTATAWKISIGGQGMLIEQANQKPIAVPYVEEQLDNHRLSFTTEANHQRIELWIAPNPCFNPVTHSQTALTATLRIDQTQQQGCAYFGPQRQP